MLAEPHPLPPCPTCGATRTRVAEDVSDEVVVLACGACDATWAERRDDPEDLSQMTSTP
jgi:hypothetical protein